MDMIKLAKLLQIYPRTYSPYVRFRQDGRQPVVFKKLHPYFKELSQFCEARTHKPDDQKDCGG